MELRARILLIGDDDDLRLSRELILRRQGYQVEAMSSNQVLNSPPDQKHDVVVIGQAVSSARAMRIAASLRQRHPGLRILRVQEAPSRLDGLFEINLETLSGPQAFLDAIKMLCESQTAKVEE